MNRFFPIEKTDFAVDRRGKEFPFRPLGLLMNRITSEVALVLIFRAKIFEFAQLQKFSKIGRISQSFLVLSKETL